DAFAKQPQLGPSFKPPSVFDAGRVVLPGRAGAAWRQKATNGAAPHGPNGAGTSVVPDAAVLQDRVDALVRAYRVRGHMMAKIDPLGLPRPTQPELDPAFYDLTAQDIDRLFSSRTIFGAESLRLRDIIRRL